MNVIDSKLNDAIISIDNDKLHKAIEEITTILLKNLDEIKITDSDGLNVKAIPLSILMSQIIILFETTIRRVAQENNKK